MKLRLFLFLWILCPISTAWGQTGYLGTQDPIEPRVQWDYLMFGPAPEGPFRVEVYYKIFNDGLTYRKEDGRYLAEYEVEVVAYQDGEQVAGTSFREVYAVESFPRTTSVTDFLLNQINLALEAPGSYELVTRLRDLRSDHASESRHQLEISSTRHPWSSSQLEFARVIQQARDTSQFNKSGLVVVPSVTRSYGGESQMECPVYFELYGPDDSQGARLHISFLGLDQQGQERFDTTVQVESRGRVTAVATALPVSHLVPGSYRVQWNVKREGESKAVCETEDRFEILWSMSTLLRADFSTAVEQLRYIASEAERDALLAAPDTMRVKAWQAFWVKRDPTPGSPANEYRDEFYRRVRYTNSMFSVGDKAGWRSDRGMIYVQYGEPDEVEQHPFDMDTYPYNAPWQVWKYYRNNLEFVFVDSRGSGDYELQYPYDGEYWRRN